MSWATLGYPAPPDTLQFRPLHDFVATRGLDEHRRVGRAVPQMCVVLTADEVLLGRRGGLTGNSPKELLARCPAGEASIEWFDTRQTVANQRNLVMRLGDHWVATTAMVHERMNIEAFVAAFGSRAVMVTP